MRVIKATAGGGRVVCPRLF